MRPLDAAWKFSHMHEQQKLGERFRFVGRTSDSHRVIRSSDLVLMSDISEAMPIAVLEAMAQGRPARAAGCSSLAAATEPSILRTVRRGDPDARRGVGTVAW